jgi:hypothetical protein
MQNEKQSKSLNTYSNVQWWLHKRHKKATFSTAESLLRMSFPLRAFLTWLLNHQENSDFFLSFLSFFEFPLETQGSGLGPQVFDPALAMQAPTVHCFNTFNSQWIQNAHPPL